MDIKKKLLEAETKCSGYEIDIAKDIIRKAIKENKQCFWSHIFYEANEGKTVSLDCITEASRLMQKDGEIRLKEDTCEHDWEYILR